MDPYEPRHDPPRPAPPRPATRSPARLLLRPTPGLALIRDEFGKRRAGVGVAWRGVARSSNNGALLALALWWLR